MEKLRKLNKMALCACLWGILYLCMCIHPVWADSTAGHVRVIVENNAMSKEQGAPWEGTLIDQQVPVTGAETMMDVVRSAVDGRYDLMETNGYIVMVNGLNAQEGNVQWLGAVDNWYVNARFDSIEVESGNTVRIVYSASGGKEEGSLDESTDTSLSALEYTQGGTIEPAFSGQTKDYRLNFPAGTNEITLTPKAVNQNYQVRVYKGKDPDVQEKGYRLTEAIPVKAGDVLTVICGDPSWPSKSKESTASVYTIKIGLDGDFNSIPEALKTSLEENMYVGETYTLDLAEIFSDVDEGTQLTYRLAEEDGEFRETAGTFEFTPEKAGTYTFRLKANDGQADSEACQITFYVDSGEERAIEIERPQVEGVTITADKTRAKKNEKVALSITLQPGVVLKRLSLLTESGEEIPYTVSYLNENGETYKSRKEINPGKCVFEMPGEAVHVSAEFTKGCKVQMAGFHSSTNWGHPRIYDAEGRECLFYQIGPTGLEYYEIYLAPGQYTYLLFNFEKYGPYDKDGPDVVKKGAFEIKEGETTRNLAFLWVHTTRAIVMEKDENLKLGFEMTLKNKDTGEEYEIWKERSHKESGGGYSYIEYLILDEQPAKKKTINFTCEVRAIDSRVTAALMSDSSNFKFSNTLASVSKIQNVQFTMTRRSPKHIFKISKGADPHFRSMGYAYQEKIDEVTCMGADGKETAVTPTTDGRYDIYEANPPGGRNMSLVAGGISSNGLPTGYKKYAYIFMGADKETEVTLDLKTDDAEVTEPQLETIATNDLYTNIRKGYMTLNKGEKKKVEGFRASQPTPDAIANLYYEPDRHYEVIYGKDRISLESAGTIGRAYQNVTAEENGIAVIKITYDDMYVRESGTLPTTVNNPGFYYVPAIDKENTGIVIVNVGGDPGEIKSNILGGELSDFHTIYFNEEIDKESAKYRFTPSAGSGTIASVRVRKPFYGEEGEAWDDAAAWSTLEPDENGAYEATLGSGRNIVEITDTAGHVLYDTINAKKVGVKIKNTTNEDRALMVGDTAEISFDGLELPIYKMAGVYNPGYPDTTWVHYQGRSEEDSGGGEYIRSRGTQYAIHKYNMFYVKIEKGGKYLLTGGQIHCGHLGDGLGSHYDIKLEGKAPNLSASGGANSPEFGRLPNITLTVQDRGPETDVMDLIAKIDPDYLSCIRTIMDARAAYDRLSAGDKAKVTNYERLTTAEADPAVSRIIPVVKKIDALPNSASLADEGAIRDADQAYRGLSSDAERNAADEATGSRLAGLVSRLEQLIAEEARRARIDAVSSLIAGLPGEDTVTGEDAVIAAINEAKRAYDALSAGEQAEVAGTAKLTGLVQSLPDLNAANNVIHAIAAIGGVTQEDYLEKTAAAEQAASLYRNLTERQQGYVSNRDVLEKAQYDIDYYGAEQAVRPAMEKLAALREALTQMQASGKPAGEGWIQWKEQIEEAQGAYDALADSQKESLADYAGVLEDARAYTRQAEADEVAAMIDALPAPETVEEYGQPQGQLTDEQVAAIAAAQNALQALTQEETVLLPAGAQEKLLALVEKAKTYPGYTEAHLRAYIEEFTQSCQRYQETGVLRKDMETITALLERYDSYTPEEQAVLDQSLAEMAGWLRGEAQRISGEVQATDELNGRIQSLPSTVDIQAWQGIQEEIQAIEADYEALSADAKGYVTGMARLESLKAQVEVFQAQAAQFQAGTPAVTAVADTPTQVTLTWDRYADATSYRIYRRVGRGGWKELTVTGALSYVDRDVKGSTTYTYALRALSTKWGQTVESAMDEDGTAVTTPFGTVTKLKSARAVRYDRVTLTWTRCADASGYEVYRAEAIRGTYKKVKTLRGSGTVTWTDTKLRTGRTYFYKIKAYRTQGGQVQRAGDSNVKSAKPTLSAAVLGKVSAGRKRAAVSWKKVNGASGYVLYRSTKKNGGYKAVRIVKRAAAGKYTDKKLKTGKTYYYKMRAYRTVDGKRVYGGYSKVRAVRVR